MPPMPIDPTHTLTIRRAYENAILSRFRQLRADLVRSVWKNDALALQKPAQSGIFALETLPVRAFDFPTSTAKVQAFIRWLNQQMDAGILEVTQAEGRGVVGDSHWQNLYIRSAYQSGRRRALADLRKAGYTREQIRFLQDSFYQPIHADRLGLIFTRNYEELNGISKATGQSIARELTQGMAEGIGPKQMARRMVDRIDKLAMPRAQMLARTEVIRSHAEAKLNTYQDAGVRGVSVMAEILTAGDEKVCATCAGWEARTSAEPIPLSEARGLIPFHPNCRCTFIPAVDGEPTGDVRRAPVLTKAA